MTQPQEEKSVIIEKPKKLIRILLAIIGAVASTSSVFFLVQKLVSEEPSSEQKIDMLLEQTQDRGASVNPVSAKTVELADRYNEIVAKMNQVRKLHKELSSQTKKIRFTEEQKKMDQISHKQETEALKALCHETEKLAQGFIQDCEDEDIDSATEADQSLTEKNVRRVRETLLVELAQIRKQYN